MTLEEFFEMLKKEHIISDMIVRLAYKYDHEKEYTYSNEILTVEWPNYDTYIWEHDWDEGQQNVWVLGYILVEDVEVPLRFKKLNLFNELVGPDVIGTKQEEKK